MNQLAPNEFAEVEGAIRAATGGLVTIEVRPGEAHYTASLSHFLQSDAYEKFWSGSFLVIAQFSHSPPGSSYVPAHVEGGKLVPGEAK